jgi:hypothetical protein
MWYVTSQKNGITASELQDLLVLGSYKTAWAMRRKLRRVMVLPGPGLLEGIVEVGLTSWSEGQSGANGSWTRRTSSIVVAAQEEGKGVGRICVRCIRDQTRASLHKFVAQTIAPGSTFRTDGLPARMGLKGYVHDGQGQLRRGQGENVLPRVRVVISLLQRYLRSMLGDAIEYHPLNDYLAKFAVSYNQLPSGNPGHLFYRLAQQAMQVAPAPFETLIKQQ